MKNFHFIHFLLLFLQIFLLFLLFGCVEFTKKPTEAIPKPQINITNVTNVTNVTNITEIIEEAKNISEEIECEKLEYGVEECIIERAVKKENVSDCYKLTNESFEKCIFSISKIDENYCYHLNDSKKIDLCFINVSIEKNKEEICNRIQNLSIKESCLLNFVNERCKKNKTKFEIYVCDAIEKNNETRCLLSGSYELCLIKFSAEKRDVCEKITKISERTACEAIVKSNEKRCEILNESMRDLCYKIYAIEKGICSVCDKINSPFYSNPCYSECAKKTLNSFYCSKPSEENIRDECYKNIAILTKNISYCKGIKLDSSRALCQIEIGKILLDMTVCDEVEIKYRRLCYIILIPLPIPIENCLKINELYSERDTCLLNAAKREKNSTACDYVSPSIKDYCLEISK
ncbi:MAG: hypothetical protein QXI58_07435 [Candidatus Micrarchaeia archaeon]